MKKLLALLLAVTMLAAGSAGAMAADVPVETISLEPRAMTLRVGDIKVITAKVIPTNATNKNLVWTSKNTSIAQVSGDGEVTAIAPGRTSIRATSADGKHWEQCSVTVIAADAPPITVCDKQPGETVHLDVQINEDQATGQEGAYRYVSPEKIRSITFQNGLMVGRELNGRIRIKPATPKYDAADAGTVLNDVMVVTLSDGSSHNFSIEMTFVDDVALLPVENSDGLTLYDGIPMGGTYTYIFELCDKANIAKGPFRVTVEQNDDDDIVKVGQFSVQGKKIFLPITPIRVGSTYMAITVEYQTDSGPKEAASGWVADVVPASSNPGENDKPTKPTRPTRPDKPSGGGGPVDDDDSPAPQATENKANEEKTQNALKAGNTVEVKLSNGTAAIDLETMGLLGAGKGTLTVINDRMTVDIPGGFGAFHEPGRIYFPFDYEQEPPCCSYEMNAAVKEGNRAKTETVKAGGNMVMPGPVTVTLKTKLTGTVNVYHYNDYNRRFTKLAEVPVADGRVTFTTRQLGHMVLTTGTI